jgi:Rps23 Pro-64 3,4-dihydroxylase Tpa1-like proline 4-hydroxylase
MDYKHIKTTEFSFILFENIFNFEEQKSIFKECIFLCDSKKLELTEKSYAARRKDGTLMKSNKGLFLEEIYTDRKYSNYLKLYKKPFELLDIKAIAEEDNNFLSYTKTDVDNTLFSYYQDGDYYESHIDSTLYTYVFWACTEPKQFNGGELVLDDINYTVEIKNNSGILFPSRARHTVNKITMQDKTPFNCRGRFSFSTFFGIK